MARTNMAAKSKITIRIATKRLISEGVCFLDPNAEIIQYSQKIIQPMAMMTVKKRIESV